jgi:serine/threonine-protein kinase
VIPTRDSAAYELYLRGKYDGASTDRRRIEMAVAELTQATQRDTAFALAYAALADVYTRGSALGFMPLGTALPLATAAADRALRFDATLAEGYAAKGFALAQRRSVAQAETVLRRAIQLNRSDLFAHHFYSMLLMMEGRVKEGTHETDLALLLDPDFPLSYAVRGVLRLMDGDRAGAREQFTAGLKLDPDNPWSLYNLGVIEAADGKFADAVARLEHARDRTPLPAVKAALAYVYSRTGQQTEASAMLASLRSADVDPLDRALGEAMLGDVDRAYAILADVRWDELNTINAVPTTSDMRANPLLARFRADARYPALLRAMGLPP